MYTMLVALVAFILSKVPTVFNNNTRRIRVTLVKQKAIGEYTFTGLMFGGYIIFTSIALEFSYGIKDTSGSIGLGSIIFSVVFMLLFLGYFIFLTLKPKFFGEYT